MTQKIGISLLLLWEAMILGALYLQFSCPSISTKKENKQQIRQITIWRIDPKTGEKLNIQKITHFDKYGRIILEFDHEPFPFKLNYKSNVWISRTYTYRSYGVGETSVSISEIGQGGLYKLDLERKYQNGKLVFESRRGFPLDATRIIKYDSLGRKI